MPNYSSQKAYTFKMGPRQKLWGAIFLIIILAFLAGLVDWPKGPEPVIGGIRREIKIHLGLDLQGGTHLVYQADVADIPAKDQGSAVEGVRDVIERRVNVFGVSEPIVQTAKVGEVWRVIVELPGVTDVGEAIQMIGETPLLEFKEYDPNAQTELTSEQRYEMESYNTDAKKRAEEILQAIKKEPARFSEIAQEKSEDPVSKEKGGELGWFARGQMVPEFEEAVFEGLEVGEVTQALIQTDFGYHIIKKNDERSIATGSFEVEGQEPQELGGNREVNASHILIRTKSVNDYIKFEDQWKYTGLTGKQLETSRVEFGQNTGAAEVSLLFNDEGKDLFAKITEQNVGNQVGIFLDGFPVSLPTVQEKIPNGKARITGTFNLTEAKELAMRLNAGALPVPINLVSQQNIGPSLGKISVEKSFLAGIIGILLIALFMIIYYRLPGLLAVLALGVYGLLVLALFKLIPVTLTLAGVAGFILSIGMAVDANVLIFERMKEELRAGKPLDLAIHEGFKRAWTSIRDGNISTLITCFILYWFGTSMIRGFGLTLGLGIIVSMFSAILITKTFLKVFERVDIGWLWGVKRNENTRL
ncbi:protein translocase subunit SecD [Patescibacteria group bacterium]|nr:protein translocase subunit SecD [Patescibacteria group bacterium]MBU4512543.1 protein translocase subunit SecD [Patescibacteria group bacterium]MCG2693071.1 protein translocase subunit SecD [Candidatus Parcubacteria bacterium]